MSTGTAERAEVLDELDYEQPCTLTQIHEQHGDGPAVWILRTDVHCVHADGVGVVCGGCLNALLAEHAGATAPCCGKTYEPARRWILAVYPLHGGA